MIKLLFLFIPLFFLGCIGDDDATINFYNKKKEHISCLKLVVFPPDAMISQTLKKLYRFDPNCPYELQASRKSGITCNSTYNVAEKTLSNFPSGYIRLDVYDKYQRPFYSYYKDMTQEVTPKDVKKAFLRLKEDIL